MSFPNYAPHAAAAPSLLCSFTIPGHSVRRLFRAVFFCWNLAPWMNDALWLDHALRQVLLGVFNFGDLSGQGSKVILATLLGGHN